MRSCCGLPARRRRRRRRGTARGRRATAQRRRDLPRARPGCRPRGRRPRSTASRPRRPRRTGAMPGVAAEPVEPVSALEPGVAVRSGGVARAGGRRGRLQLAGIRRRALLARRRAARVGHARFRVRRVGGGHARLVGAEHRVARPRGGDTLRLDRRCDRRRRRVRRAGRADERVDGKQVAERPERVDRQRLDERVLQQRLEAREALAARAARVGLDRPAAVVEVVQHDREVLRQLRGGLGELVEVLDRGVGGLDRDLAGDRRLAERLDRRQRGVRERRAGRAAAC